MWHLALLLVMSPQLDHSTPEGPFAAIVEMPELFG